MTLLLENQIVVQTYGIVIDGSMICITVNPEVVPEKIIILESECTVRKDNSKFLQFAFAVPVQERTRTGEVFMIDNFFKWTKCSMDSLVKGTAINKVNF